jgi:hypothetical protein
MELSFHEEKIFILRGAAQPNCSWRKFTIRSASLAYLNCQGILRIIFMAYIIRTALKKSTYSNEWHL